MTDTRFEGTDRYVATDDLMMAVNAAITLCLGALQIVVIGSFVSSV